MRALKIDIDFYTQLVQLLLEEGKKNYGDIDFPKEQIHLLVDKAAEAAKSALEAGL